MNEDTQQNMELTAQEEAFCDLYVHGGMEFAGQILKCYRKIFGGTASMRDSAQARSLLLQPRMMARVKEMISTEQYEMETAAVKLQVGEPLKTVMAEAATQNYLDRFGAPLSPAPLRAVSVNAAKALMELTRSNMLRRAASASRAATATSSSTLSYLKPHPHMPRKKIDRQEVAFWVYMALLVVMAAYGLWNSAAAEPLIRVLRDAFSLIIQQ